MPKWWESTDAGWDDRAPAWSADERWNSVASNAWAAAAPSDAAPKVWDTQEHSSAGNQWGTEVANGGAQMESWNVGWGASDGVQAPKAPRADAFWETQKWNVQQGVLSRKEEWELEKGDAELFSERLGTSAGIDFTAYDHVPVQISGTNAEHIVACKTFDEIYDMFREQIPEACIRNVRLCHYTVPTPVQKYALPVGLAGRDVMCCAQTGSGKTAAFLIPIIGAMMKSHDNPVGALTVPFEGKCKPDTLILSPTRELCIQIHEESSKMCHRTPYRCCRAFGGEPTKVQLEDLSKGCDLLVATPGRLQDFINREVVDVSATFVLVLDEADRMLDMGFEAQIREIVEQHDMPTKEERQTMMFSATFPKECQEMAADFLHDYIWIGVGVVGGAVTTVTQSLRKVQASEKFNLLIETLDEFYETRTDQSRCLVFVNSKNTAKYLDEKLFDLNMDTGALHGNLTQDQRQDNLLKFRRGEIDVMVATDVAARGLDIENVDLVVNYDMPNDTDTYVHRIGRSGRIGNRGAAITFISVDEHGASNENFAVLGNLLQIMKDAQAASASSVAEIPDWFLSQVENKDDWGAAAGQGSWSGWESKDMRGHW